MGSFRESMTIGCSLIGSFPDNEIPLDETSERKSNNCAGGWMWSLATIDGLQEAGEIPPFRDKRGRHLPDFTGSGGALAIDVKWQLLRPDDGKIYPQPPLNPKAPATPKQSAIHSRASRRTT